MMLSSTPPPVNKTTHAQVTADSSSSSNDSSPRRPSANAGGAERRPKTTFMSLPTEIHLAISERLIYPDALSLKYTNRYFHGLVYTGLHLKVEWLIERRRLHLECPNQQKCDLGTDLKFCRGSVALLMKRRREHIECESREGLGCIIYGTPTCPARRNRLSRWRSWMNKKLTIEVRWMLLALVPVLLSVFLELFLAWRG